jgi:superoxide dismutase, Fe-Mn family
MTRFTRRNLIGAVPAAATLIATAKIARAQTSNAGASMPFHLDPLPYATNSLEPTIDAKTMEIHHDKHHAAYVNNLNAAAKEAPQFAQQPMEVVLADLNSVPESVRTMVRNNMGGHVNHTMFWQIMGANGGKPAGDVLAAIDRDFGGLEKLQSDFNAAGGRVFGSGWVFVTVTRDGKLALETKPNQDTPLMDGKRVLFGNDVWEHAYYLTYQNRRPDYLKAWWNTVNWAKIAERYEQAKKGTLTI